MFRFFFFNEASEEGSIVIVFVSEGSIVTACSNEMVPNIPCSFPFTLFALWLCSVTAIVNEAEAVSGRGNLEETNGSSILTGPPCVIYTLFQIPVLRPRMVGIQSHPIEA